MPKTPKISIIIPTFNESKNIKNCLDSIFTQNYSLKELEVIVVDNNSTDDTAEIVKKFPIKLLKSDKRHGEISKMIGFKAAAGEYVVYIDADIELRGAGWIKRMIKPLEENKDIIGSFTRYYSKQSDPAIERYLTMDPLQRDGIYQFFSPSIKETVIEEKDEYSICQYNLTKIPPAGLCVYRRENLMPIISSYDMFLELDFLVLLVKNGLNMFAYVPSAGLFHHHVSTFGQLLRKRKYNLMNVYLLRDERQYKWFDLKDITSLCRIFVWVVYANLFIPSIVTGICKSLKYRDWAGMYEPIINILITDMFILFFLKDRRTLALFR